MIMSEVDKDRKGEGKQNDNVSHVMLEMMVYQPIASKR